MPQNGRLAAGIAQRYAKILRAESAKGMLANARRSIGQIGVMVGYAEPRSAQDRGSCENRRVIRSTHTNRRTVRAATLSK